MSIPLVIAIAGPLVIVTRSYRQTIYAYPNGGGAYIVARDNLGELPARITGAALLTDYILTVAVSISAGVEQITSDFQALIPFRTVWAKQILQQDPLSLSAAPSHLIEPYKVKMWLVRKCNNRRLWTIMHVYVCGNSTNPKSGDY